MCGGVFAVPETSLQHCTQIDQLLKPLQIYQNGLTILNILTFKTGCSAFRLSYLDIIRNVDVLREGVREAFQKIDSFVDELKAEARYIKNTREIDAWKYREPGD